MTAEPPDLYGQIAELEAQLQAARATLTGLRVAAPSSGCSNPSHAAAADKIASLENLLSKMARGKRTTQKLAAGRGDRLLLEIERVKSEIVRLTPLTTHGNRALLDRLKAAQHRRRILELRAQQQPVTALVAPVAPLSFAGLERSPGRGRDAGWMASIAAALTTLFWVGTASSAALVLLAALVSAIGLSDWVFPGARRELVTPHMIYGERWRYVKSIVFAADGTLTIATARRTHVLDATTPGFHDVVRLTLAAAETNKLTVSGAPPTLLALPSGMSTS